MTDAWAGTAVDRLLLLRARWWVLVLLPLVAVVLAGGLLIARAPRYEAQAMVWVSPMQARLVAALAQSAAVTDRAAVRPGRVVADYRAAEELLILSAVEPDAAMARDEVNRTVAALEVFLAEKRAEVQRAQRVMLAERQRGTQDEQRRLREELARRRPREGSVDGRAVAQVMPGVLIVGTPPRDPYLEALAQRYAALGTGTGPTQLPEAGAGDLATATLIVVRLAGLGEPVSKRPGAVLGSAAVVASLLAVAWVFMAEWWRLEMLRRA